MQVIYKVKINNWQKYNAKHNTKYKAFLLHSGFFSDQKISNLKQMEVQLFIYLMCVRAESSANEFEIHAKCLPRAFRMGEESLANALSRLQSFQLVSFEILNSLSNRIEKKEREKKEREVQAPQVLVPEIVDQPTKQKPDTELNRKIWDAYRQAFVGRHKVEPVRNAKANAQISQLGKRLGTEAVLVAKFYVMHNDSFYLKTQHSLDGLLANAESLRTQMLKGTAVTSTMVREFEKNNAVREKLDLIDKEGI